MTKEIVELIHQELGKEVPEGCFGTVQRNDVGMKYLALNGLKLKDSIDFLANIQIESLINQY